MGDYQPKPPSLKAGARSISARDFNELRGMIPSLLSGSGDASLKKIGDRFVIDSETPYVQPTKQLQDFVVLEEYADCVACVPVSVLSNLYTPNLGAITGLGGLITFVAKPYWLQQTPFDGQTVKYQDRNQPIEFQGIGIRTSDGRNQTIVPEYFPGSIITAQQNQTAYYTQIPTSPQNYRSGFNDFGTQVRFNQKIWIVVKSNGTTTAPGGADWRDLTDITIPTWIAGSYDPCTLVRYIGKIWVQGSNTPTTYMPGATNTWKDFSQAYPVSGTIVPVIWTDINADGRAWRETEPTIGELTTGEIQVGGLEAFVTMRNPDQNYLDTPTRIKVVDNQSNVANYPLASVEPKSLWNMIYLRNEIFGDFRISLQGGNLNHPLTDPAWWARIRINPLTLSAWDPLIDYEDDPGADDDPPSPIHDQTVQQAGTWYTCVGDNKNVKPGTEDPGRIYWRLWTPADVMQYLPVWVNPYFQNLVYFNGIWYVNVNLSIATPPPGNGWMAVKGVQSFQAATTYTPGMVVTDSGGGFWANEGTNSITSATDPGPLLPPLEPTSADGWTSISGPIAYTGVDGCGGKYQIGTTFSAGSISSYWICTAPDYGPPSAPNWTLFSGTLLYSGATPVWNDSLTFPAGQLVQEAILPTYAADCNPARPCPGPPPAPPFPCYPQCNDLAACNYLECSDCYYPCEDSSACDYGHCIPCYYACANPLACNFGECFPCWYACADPAASNYGACTQCEYLIPNICTDNTASNYGQPGPCVYSPPPLGGCACCPPGILACLPSQSLAIFGAADFSRSGYINSQYLPAQFACSFSGLQPNGCGTWTGVAPICPLPPYICTIDGSAQGGTGISPGVVRFTIATGYCCGTIANVVIENTSACDFAFIAGNPNDGAFAVGIDWTVDICNQATGQLVSGGFFSSIDSQHTTNGGIVTLSASTFPSTSTSTCPQIAGMGSSGGTGIVTITGNIPTIGVGADVLTGAAPFVIKGYGFTGTVVITPSTGTIASVVVVDSVTLNVVFATPPSVGPLTFAVTSNGVPGGNIVQVANVVANPTVTMTTTAIGVNVPSIDITTTGANPNPAGNSVVLTDSTGAVIPTGAVFASNANGTKISVYVQGIIAHTGAVKAVVTSSQASSGAAMQVAAVAALVSGPTVNLSAGILFSTVQNLTFTGTGLATATTVAFSQAGGIVPTGTVSTAAVGYVTVSNLVGLVGGPLYVVVTNGAGNTSGTPIQIYTGVQPLKISPSTTNFSQGTKTLTINGQGFTAPNSTTTVTTDSGIILSSTINSTSITITFDLTQPAPALGDLTATVTNTLVGSDSAEVANVIGPTVPTLATATTDLSIAASNIMVDGFEFDPVPVNNVLMFNLGAVGRVVRVSPSQTQINIALTTLPAITGPLYAVLTTTYAGSSGLQATITNVAVAAGVATITTSPAHGYSTGQWVKIAGLTHTALNGGLFQIIVTGVTTFTFAILTPDIASVADSGTANAAVEIANIIASAGTPTITPSGNMISSNVPFTINGTNFSTTLADNRVWITNGGVAIPCTLLASTTTTLTVLPTSAMYTGPVYGSVTVAGVNSTTVQVGVVVGDGNPIPLFSKTMPGTYHYTLTQPDIYIVGVPGGGGGGVGLPAAGGSGGGGGGPRPGYGHYHGTIGDILTIVLGPLGTLGGVHGSDITITDALGTVTIFGGLSGVTAVGGPGGAGGGGGALTSTTANWTTISNPASANGGNGDVGGNHGGGGGAGAVDGGNNVGPTGGAAGRGGGFIATGAKGVDNTIGGNNGNGGGGGADSPASGSTGGYPRVSIYPTPIP